MSELTKQDISNYKSQLLARKQVMLDAEATLQQAGAVVELDQTRMGRLSRMDALQGQAMSKALQQRNKQQLTEVEAALKRIEQGDFGYCQRCDEMIACQRLDISPAVKHCIKCAD